MHHWWEQMCWLSLHTLCPPQLLLTTLFILLIASTALLVFLPRHPANRRWLGFRLIDRSKPVVTAEERNCFWELLHTNITKLGLFPVFPSTFHQWCYSPLMVMELLSRQVEGHHLKVSMSTDPSDQQTQTLVPAPPTQTSNFFWLKMIDWGLNICIWWVNICIFALVKLKNHPSVWIDGSGKLQGFFLFVFFKSTSAVIGCELRLSLHQKWAAALWSDLEIPEIRPYLLGFTMCFSHVTIFQRHLKKAQSLQIFGPGVGGVPAGRWMFYSGGQRWVEEVWLWSQSAVRGNSSLAATRSIGYGNRSSSLFPSRARPGCRRASSQADHRPEGSADI